MAITDLTGTTWIFNDEINIPSTTEFSISFISNSTNYNKLYMISGSGPSLELQYDTIAVWGISGWLKEEHKTINITGGTDATNTDLINWLQANATLQATPTTDTKPVYKRVNGSWVKQLAFERVNGQWVKISSKEEIENLEIIDDVVANLSVTSGHIGSSLSSHSTKSAALSKTSSTMFVDVAGTVSLVEVSKNILYIDNTLKGVS